MAGQLAIAGSRPINQLQSLQTRDDLSGLDVEGSLEAQNLNRRQQIANLLMQQGLQPIHGQQAGRFYVPPSWTQGLAQLASAGLGAALTNNLGQEQADLGRQAQEQRAQAIQDYIQKTSPQLPQTSHPVPEAGAYLQQANSPEEASKNQYVGLEQPSPELNDFRARAFTGGLPQPELTAPPVPQMPSDAAKREALIKVLTARDPSIRRFGELQFQQQAHEREQAAQREQQTAEKALDRDVRREGILANADMRAAQIEGNMAITKMNIANNERAGQDASELKKDLARMTADLQNTLHDKDNATRLKIAEIGAEAKAASKTEKGMSVPAQKELITTEEETQSMQQSLKSISQAMEINDKAMGFRGAGAVASVGTLIPEGMRPETINATLDLDNLVTSSVLPQLRAVFQSNPTEGERKVLLDVAGSSSLPASERKVIFDRAKSALNARMQFNIQKAEALRKGTYFTGDGGMQAPTPAPAAPVVPGQPSLDDLLNKYK